MACPTGIWILAALWAIGPVDVVQAVSVGRSGAAVRLDAEASRATLLRPAWAAASAHDPSAFPYRAFEGELCRVEQRLFVDAADGRWDEHSLLVAALVASGVTQPEMLARYELQVAGLAAELDRSGRMNGPARARAQALFEFMHQRILVGGYQLDCTDLSVALDEGRFNCVSASVLFNCLAGRFGLETVGLEIPGHATSRLILPDAELDVETTCPGWFRLMDNPEKQAALVEATLGVARPRKGAVAPRVVSPVELIGTIYYNRGVDLLAVERFEEALQANAKALRLDPLSETARGNLLATLNNWAIDRGSAGDYGEAVALLDRGLALDPHYQTFKANYVHVHHQWIESLCRAEQFQGALEVATEASRKQPDEPYFRQIREEVHRRWSRVRVEADRAAGSFRGPQRAG